MNAKAAKAADDAPAVKAAKGNEGEGCREAQGSNKDQSCCHGGHEINEGRSCSKAYESMKVKAVKAADDVTAMKALEAKATKAADEVLR